MTCFRHNSTLMGISVMSKLKWKAAWLCVIVCWPIQMRCQFADRGTASTCILAYRLTLLRVSGNPRCIIYNKWRPVDFMPMWSMWDCFCKMLLKREAGTNWASVTSPRRTWLPGSVNFFMRARRKRWAKVTGVYSHGETTICLMGFCLVMVYV